MSEAATTRETDSQEGDKKQQACTGPLKPIPEGKDFKEFVAKVGFGKAQPKEGKLGLGLGIYVDAEDAEDKKQGKKQFPSPAVEAIFTDDNLRYEECTKNRIESHQKDGDKIIKEKGYGEDYNLKPVAYIPTAKYLEEKEKLLKDSPLKEEIEKALEELEQKDDGKGPDEFLKGMFGTVANMMEEPNKGVIPELLQEYYQFLEKFQGDHGKIDDYYKELVIDKNGKFLYELYKLEDGEKIPDCKDDPFKAIMCFAYEKAMIDEDDEMKGGADELVVFGDRSRWRRIAVRMLAVFFLICYGFLIYESSRLLMSSINRVLDAREAYYQENPDMREEDKVAGGDGGYMSYLYGIGQVAIEIFGGGLITSITTIKDFAVDQARHAASKIADQTGRAMVNRHSNGVVSFINGFLTGDTQAEASAVAGIERQAEMNRISNEAIKEVNLQFEGIVADAAFSANGFVTGINGMATSLVVLGNTIRPDIYRIEHVTASCAALRGAYSPDKMLKYASTTGNLAILFNPNSLAFPSYPQRVPEASKDVVPVEESKGSESAEESNGSESAEKSLPEQPKPTTGILSFLTGTSDQSVPAEGKKKKTTEEKSQKEIDAANALADMSLGNKKGGKRKTGKKLIDIFGGRKKRKTSKNNKKRKTIKKKSKKGKTKKRKTLKKRRKGKK